MPLIQVTFKNEALAQNYKAEVETFLHKLLAKENDEKCSAQDDKTFQLQIYQDFCIDSVPDLNDNDSEVWDIPLYNHAYKDILDQNGNSEKLTFIRCFNCLGNHFLDKCPEVLDRQRIAYNRKFFFGINNRYNLKGPMQQIKQFQPGAISKELRDALALKDDQLPQYIYKMRILGYPPGWLKEAEIYNSELAMYDCQGKVKLYEENIQNGSDSENYEVKYDSEKIFEYPGFNVPVPPGFKDKVNIKVACIKECVEIGMPSIQPYHLMDINATNSESMPYIKRKFPNQYEKNKRLKNDEIEEVDMDIESIDQGRIIYSDDEEARLCKFIPPLPHDTPIQVPAPPPPPPPIPLSDDAPAFVEETQICANLLSPTLTELEEEKQRLMNELQLELEENKKDTSDETENINNCDKVI
ncbi:zinc finger CCHC domain-containing protein 8-like [Centruroides vittatus]|uniref:zinc finger CCHC domain-containing protein 8-like n=1 Tax=Centruroides vittatus TaxID=120091 RepID=UPI0035104286